MVKSKKTADLKETKGEQKSLNPTVSKVLKDFNASWDYVRSSWHERWEDNYYLYNNNRVKRGYDGITDTFVPMTFSTVETMTSALFGTKPSFEFVPPSEKEDQNTEILNSLVDYFWEKDKWSIKVINWGRQFLQLGTSVVYLHWDVDCPRMVNVPIRDFFIDPTATTLENARYMGRRFLTTKEDLKSFEVVDFDKSTPEKTVYKKKYKNLGRVKGTTGDQQTDKEQKDMFYGSTLTNANKEQVEVIEYWTEDKVISIANREIVIEEAENIFKAQDRENGSEHPRGLLPFACLRDYVDGSLFYAKGEIDFIADQQELLNDITNQNIDSITYSLNQMYTLDPAYADKIEEVENIPGAVYPFEAGALQPIDQRPIPGDAFNERMNIKNEIRETTASNEIVKGTTQDSNATATEIQAQIAGAGQRMGLKVTQIEDEGFHQLARLVFRMVQLFVSEPMMVRVVGRDGIRWEEFDPGEFDDEYEPRVRLETTVNSEKQQQADNAKEMYAAFLNDPDVNQLELKKLVLQRGFDLDPDEVNILTAEPEVEELPEDPLAGQTDALMPGLDLSGLAPTEPMMDVIQDPVTGELLPIEPELAAV